MRPARDAASDYIADTRTKLQEQRRVLHGAHHRLADQLDRLAESKADVWPARAEALKDAEALTREVLTRSGNDACADCGGPAAYARVDLGITICAKCAAYHKALLPVREDKGNDDRKLAPVAPELLSGTAHAEAAAAALAAAPLGEAPSTSLLLALESPLRLCPLPGIAPVPKSGRHDLLPLAADLTLVRAIGNIAANDVFEQQIRGSTRARSMKPTQDCAAAEREAFVRSKYLIRQFASAEPPSRDVIQSAAAGDVPSLLYYVYRDSWRSVTLKVSANLKEWLL
jgi:hypothetical protein